MHQIIVKVLQKVLFIYSLFLIKVYWTQIDVPSLDLGENSRIFFLALQGGTDLYIHRH